MTKRICRKCRKIIIEDYEKFVENETSKNKEFTEILCPYCGYWEKEDL